MINSYKLINQVTCKLSHKFNVTPIKIPMGTFKNWKGGFYRSQGKINKNRKEKEI